MGAAGSAPHSIHTFAARNDHPHEQGRGRDQKQSESMDQRGVRKRRNKPSAEVTPLSPDLEGANHSYKSKNTA